MSNIEIDVNALSEVVNDKADRDLGNLTEEGNVKLGKGGLELCDIGMASRALKKSETDAGVEATVIATDGIAVIVNKGNKVDNMTKAQVADIFTGKVTTWDKLAK